MKPGGSELRGRVNEVCFIDANVFLELLLGQKRADECETFLRKVERGLLRAATTDFHIDTVLIVMENYGKGPRELKLFLSSLLGYRGLEVYFLSLADRIAATRHMEELGLDLDDALLYQAMMKLGSSKVVSYDRHLDRITGIARLEPAELV